MVRAKFDTVVRIQFVASTIIALLVLAVSCSATRQPHPGAVSQADSDAYDALLLAYGGLEAVRAEIESGTLPQGLIPAYNAAVDAYGLAKTSWLAYRGLYGLDTADPEELADRLAEMMAHVAAITRMVAELIR